MKRVFWVLFTALLAVLFAACGTNETKEESSSGMITSEEVSQEETKAEGTGKFMVGYGQVNITPAESVPLAGYGNTDQRMSNGMYSYLYTTCTAFTDVEGTTMLIFANDLINTNWDYFEAFQDAVSQSTSVPKENIIFTSSHTHSGPDLGQIGMSVIADYQKLLSEYFVEAANLALADRSEARMFYADAEVNDMSFIRHSIMADGTKTGYSPTQEVIGYAGYKDTQMQFLKFSRAEFDSEKKDIIITNWQVHPHRAGGQSELNITADIAGVYRDTVQKKLNCLCQYITGAAGNTNPKSYLEADNVTKDYKEQGKAMAEYCINAEGSYVELETGLIQIHQIAFTVNYDHSMDGMISVAKDVQAYWKETNDIAKTKTYGAPYGINSPYHANKIVSMSYAPKTKDFALSYGSIGDFAFGTFPGEMFAKGGMIVKEESPYKATFFIGYSNGHYGYFPTEDAYEYVGYETDVTLFERGTAERVASELANRLKELFNTK